MMTKKDIVIMAHLRNNSRATITEMAKRTNIPISTIYDKLKLHEGSAIQKHTCLLDFSKIGFSTKANVVLKIERDSRDAAQEFLLKNSNVNSVYKINNGFDFLVECVFKHLKELEDFLEGMESRFKILDKKIYYVIEDIKREGFMSDPGMVETLL